jgi:DNA-binding NtrC family response regulator
MARILLVDDDEALQKLCKEELEDEGHSVELTADGDDALERIGRGGLDLVILDLCIDGMSGLRVLREGINRSPDLPILIHTAHPEFQRHFSTWSAAAFVVKSSDLGPLMKEVHRLAGAGEMVKQAA